MRIFHILAFSLLFFVACNQETKQLPIYGERTPVEKQENGTTTVDTIYHTIPDFSLLNQDSVLITQEEFNDKIYIANFFFTHCPSICPTMQRNMLGLYQEFKDEPNISFLSHSIDFKYDSPSVLKEYANKLGVNDDRWQFVTGSKKEVYGLADMYMVYTQEDENAPGGYDHQGYLLLIDKEKRIRGAYDGTEKEQVALLQEDIKVLLNE